MTIEEIAQWVIDNRYPKSEKEKVSDSEMYHTVIEMMNKALTIPDVRQSICTFWDSCNSKEGNLCIDKDDSCRYHKWDQLQNKKH